MERKRSKYLEQVKDRNRRECTRDVSSDKEIENEIPNDFNEFLGLYPNINHVFFNGEGASEYIDPDSIDQRERSRFKILPSTLSMNIHLTIEMKFVKWGAVKECLEFPI